MRGGDRPQTAMACPTGSAGGVEMREVRLAADRRGLTQIKKLWRGVALFARGRQATNGDGLAHLNWRRIKRTGGLAS